MVATHRNLEEQVRQGAFARTCITASLFSPLRFHRFASGRKILGCWPDISCDQLCGSRTIGNRESFQPRRCERLSSIAWPGNVREMRNVIERVCCFLGRPDRCGSGGTRAAAGLCVKSRRFQSSVVARGWIACRSGRIIRARDTGGGTEAAASSHDEYGQGPGP